MSKGTLQRMMLMIGFLRKTKNLLLDEPFNGLDPIQLKNSLDYCKENKNNKCIIISSHDIQVSAESLIGGAKGKRTNWCKKYYENDILFQWAKELERILANKEKYIVCFIISITIVLGGKSIPYEYQPIAYIIIVILACNFNITMNRTEAGLLLRGYIKNYNIVEIIKNKILIYSLTNYILLMPSINWDWRLLVVNILVAFVVALGTLLKCFRYK